ncbi:MAG: hypothetical protein HC786_13445 [Richelia sp. CSU_2_1]|nr:hypothetical protein [Richelia sp. CSU_2_1]
MTAIDSQLSCKSTQNSKLTHSRETQNFSSIQNSIDRERGRSHYNSKLRTPEQLSTVNCQLSTLNYQLSTLNYRLF